MIYVICGMIGAGKIEYAKKTGCPIIENVLNQNANKKEQIEQTLDLYDSGSDVCHITCYPTEQEQSAFHGLDVKYIWINTTKQHCIQNVRKRRRGKDLIDINSVKEKNDELEARYENSFIHFKVIDLYETGEKW